MPELTRPHARLRESFLAAIAEFVQEGNLDEDSTTAVDLARFGAVWHTGEGFGSYVEQTLADSERPRRPGFVRQTTWWWVDGTDYLGRISLRHELTEQLLQVGGHIGYDVRRSRRREGHATRMLAAVLPEAARLGIDPALVTCDVCNVASRRVIESNGGVLEDQRGVKLRYWVPTVAH
ncbi:MAG: GCN5-related N-acetyltransferase [Marmoricola sp.]|nr:GCN5-related N-acetyltransferase [Marmoricola sp.]